MVRTKWRTILMLVVAALVALTLSSCKISNSAPEEPQQGDDAALWAGIVWVSPWWTPKPDAAKVLTLGVTAINPGSGCLTDNKYDPRFQEAQVTYTYDTIPWRAGDPNRGNDGILQCFFIWNDQKKAYEGTAFEWWEPFMGQTCGMINAQDRANGKAFMHRPPCSGDKVAFAWSNFAGTQRSNLVEYIWP